MTALFQRRFPATDSSGSVEDNLFNAGVQPVVGSGRLETPDDPFIFGVINAYRRCFRYDCNERIRIRRYRPPILDSWQTRGMGPHAHTDNRS
jgi:hypothetical protein